MTLAPTRAERKMGSPTDAVRDVGSDQVLHVLDLPQLYTRPSSRALLDALALLELQLPSWDISDDEDNDQSLHGATKPQSFRSRPHVMSQGIPQYLTDIVASRLSWLDDESLKEQIWELASQRLSERSGRTAMGTVTRRFKVPLSAHRADLNAESFDINIHEPGMTEDSLGHKTWAASYLLARRLSKLLLPHLSSGVSSNVSLPPSTSTSSAPLRSSATFSLVPWKILELGSGTGLLGIAAAAVFRQPVLLTDMAEIVPNLAYNVSQNRPAIQQAANDFSSMHTQAAVLDWTQANVCRIRASNGEPEQLLSPSMMTFPLILAADSLYSVSHAELLCTAITTWLAHLPEARVVTEFPLRLPDESIRADFRSRMEKSGLRVLAEGTEEGRDDWGAKERVRCWWSVWQW